MSDPTVSTRIKRQREARTSEGWQEVRVWVPTESDAEAVRELAAKCRRDAGNLTNLNKAIRSMTPENISKSISAIVNQGSSAYKTQSGAVLTLLSELAANGEVADLSRAFVIFAQAKPGNAHFVEQAVPAKITNGYFIAFKKLSQSAVAKWQIANPVWPNRVKECLRQPTTFQTVLEDVASQIKAFQESLPRT